MEVNTKTQAHHRHFYCARTHVPEQKRNPRGCRQKCRSQLKRAVNFGVFLTPPLTVGHPGGGGMLRVWASPIHPLVARRSARLIYFIAFSSVNVYFSKLQRRGLCIHTHTHTHGRASPLSAPSLHILCTEFLSGCSLLPGRIYGARMARKLFQMNGTKWFMRPILSPNSPCTRIITNRTQIVRATIAIQYLNCHNVWVQFGEVGKLYGVAGAQTPAAHEWMNPAVNLVELLLN